MSDLPEKKPVVSEGATRVISVAFAIVIIGGVFAAMSMLVVWGLIWMFELLFG